tara:strand:+ start:1986 stop:2204 length:219 start_codon:yes stop_codon:yes gene_type:complete
MCRYNAPEYEAPPSYARPKAPDNAALYSEAMNRAAMRGGGAKRSTFLSGLFSAATPPTLGKTQPQRPTTTLG